MWEKTYLLSGALYKTFTSYLIVTIALLAPLGQYTIPGASASMSKGICSCVVFRMDDIQDYWLNSPQVAAMNSFISKNYSLSLGLIMHKVGNDSKIISKVNQGLSAGLFELDLNGWDHTNYTKLTEKEQIDSLNKANMKMHNLFGTKSIVFIPPFDVFDNNTINAMRELGIRIISSAPHEENTFDHNRTVFIASNAGVAGSKSALVYHLPSTIFFKYYEKGNWVTTPLSDIIGNVTRNIERYGYAVVVINPQDFAKYVNGSFVNSVDQKGISGLSQLIDFFSSKDIHIMPFHKVVTTPVYSKALN